MENHHGDERISINCKAVPESGTAMVEKNPTVYHIPKFIRRWGVGIWLDVKEVDWEEVEALLLEAYFLVAPKRMVAATGRPTK